MRPFEAFRARKLGQIDAAYARRLRLGFATADFDGQPEPETLQCRDATDQIRWIGLLLKCQAAIARGGGSLPIDPPIRCTSNREYAVSHEDAQARMFALLNAYAATLKHYWSLKDQARSVTRRSELDLIDLEAWP